MGETYLQFGKQEGRWGGRFRSSSATAEQFRSWVSSDDNSYTNSIEFIDTNIDEGTAAVVTKETGSQGVTPWEGVTNLWLVANQGGEWKIVGSRHFMPE
jgi:hypothetical protein